MNSIACMIAKIPEIIAPDPAEILIRFEFKSEFSATNKALDKNIKITITIETNADNNT